MKSDYFRMKVLYTLKKMWFNMKYKIRFVTKYKKMKYTK